MDCRQSFWSILQQKTRRDFSVYLLEESQQIFFHKVQQLPWNFNKMLFKELASKSSNWIEIISEIISSNKYARLEISSDSFPCFKFWQKCHLKFLSTAFFMNYVKNSCTIFIKNVFQTASGFGLKTISPEGVTSTSIFVSYVDIDFKWFMD